MNHTTKMLMVPQDTYSRLVTQQQMQPAVAQLTNLDEHMQQILSNPNISVDVKYNMYEQALRRYRVLNEQQQQPMKVEMVQPEVQPVVQPEITDFNIVDALPKSAKLKGRLLLNHIKQAPGIKVSEHGELILNGKKIPGTNITDLVHDFVRDRSRAQPATGWHEFREALKNSNVPQEAIANKRRMVENFDGMANLFDNDSVHTSPAVSPGFATPNSQIRLGTYSPPIDTVRRGSRVRKETMRWTPYGSPPKYNV